MKHISQIKPISMLNSRHFQRQDRDTQLKLIERYMARLSLQQVERRAYLDTIHEPNWFNPYGIGSKEHVAYARGATNAHKDGVVRYHGPVN